jgi:CelD/BcsL family acetyltransferase involved in cellulose biosynthesis
LFLLPRLADIDAAARRRLNYEVLLEAFRDRAPPAFSTVPEGASPLVFPLEAEIDGDVADRLAQRGIDARPFWPVLHPSVPHAAFPGAAAWRRRFLALPVHQELRFEDLQRVIAAVNGRRRRSEMRLEPLDDFASVREEWNSLAEASGNVFATWEWASIWWRHFGDGHRQLAAACRDPKGTLIAILPLYVSSARSLRIARFVGEGPADQLGPVCAPHDRGRAAAALRILLSTSRGWDVFVGEQLPGDEGWSALLGARRIDRSGSPVIRFETEDWDGFLSTLSSRFRHEIRSDERKLRREHDLRFRLAGDAASLDEDLEKLFALHAGRWPGSAFGTRHRAFHREFAHSAFGRGWLRLWFLEIDGDPVAAWYGFRFAGVESHYQGGRDPAWARSSVGLVVLAHSIREALADGMREYRFLRGAEQHKYRFTKLDPGLETVALGRGVAGRAALATYTAARNARDLARASAAAFRNAGPPRR